MGLSGATGQVFTEGSGDEPVRREGPSQAEEAGSSRAR